MGYESKLIVGLRGHSNYGRDYCENLMVLDLCKMDDMNFNNMGSKLFTREIDFDLFKDDGNTRYKEDCYGSICKYASLQDVVEYLKEFNDKLKANGKYYRRSDMAYKALKAFKKKDWENDDYELVVVHYGY